MKSQKGISLTTLIIIVAIIIVGIISIVKMSEVPDGIGTVEEEQEKYNKILQEQEKANKQYQDALENYQKTKKDLEEAEKQYSNAPKQPTTTQKPQTTTTKNYQQIYNEYSQKLINAGATSSISEMATILNDGVTEMARYMYSASGTDGQYATYQSWVDKLYNVYMNNCR